MKTAQELAQQLAQIHWSKVQSDCPHENEKVAHLRSIVLKMDKADAVNLLLEVMEARILSILYPSYPLFSEMAQFDRMYHSYPSFVAPGAPRDEDTDHWLNLCVKLDTMAKYRDNKHFGLPMGQIHDMISVVKQEYELKKVI